MISPIAIDRSPFAPPKAVHHILENEASELNEEWGATHDLLIRLAVISSLTAPSRTPTTTRRLFLIVLNGECPYYRPGCCSCTAGVLRKNNSNRRGARKREA
ncbi:hypothetical protein TcCL_NonESM10596 [Trypanosoma cruzi]|nr:hypothetical protein TcCL_NonESM10596 [Trypanosoma cruzi]